MNGTSHKLQGGLTDCDWCRENGININSFYAWVRSLRKEACHPIPDPGRHHADNGICANEVVKIEILPEEQFTHHLDKW